MGRQKKRTKPRTATRWCGDGDRTAAALEARLQAVRAILACGLVAGIFSSLPLWVSNRPFPLLPRFAFVPILPVPFDCLVLGVVLALAVAVAIRSQLRWETFALCAGLAFLIVLDQNRCQPWVYQYAVMLLVAAPGQDSRAPFATLQLMLAGIYAWSGLQKVNVVFAGEVFPKTMGPLVAHLPPLLAHAVARGGYVAAAVEALIAPGLLIPRTRRIALVVLITMHGAILAAIGPFGTGSNSAVWPWNLAMIALAVTLFRGVPHTIAARAAWADRPAVWLRRAALTAFLVLPALNFVALWPNYLSWALYSGTFLRGRMTVATAAVACLPDDLRSGLVKIGTDTQAVSIFDWGMNVFNAPPYSEWWVYRRIRDRACRCDPDGRWITFTLLDPARWSPSYVQRYHCGDAW